MPIYRPTPSVANRPWATMLPLKARGSATPTPPVPPTPTPQIANPPSAPSLAHGSGSTLTVTWSAPAIDSTHVRRLGSISVQRPQAPAPGHRMRQSPALTHCPAWRPMHGYRRAAPEHQCAWHKRMVRHQHLDHGRRRTERPAALSLAQGSGSDLTVTWTAPPADSMPQRTDQLQPAIQPFGHRHLGHRNRCHEPVRPVRPCRRCRPSTCKCRAQMPPAPAHGLPPSTLDHGQSPHRTADCPVTGTRRRHQPHRHLDCPSTRQHAQRRHGLQPAIQPLRRRHLDDGVGRHQPIHASRSGSRRGISTCRSKASNTAGSSAWSATSTLTTAAAAPNAPTLLIDTRQRQRSDRNLDRPGG